VASVLPGSFVAFVTMTMPNVAAGEDLAGEARKLKKKITNFRRRSSCGAHVLGGIDVVENTVAADGSWNLHHHGIWVMDKYWSQEQLQETWGHGIVHIEKVRKSHAVMRYLVSYATKEPIKGVRCLETFGAARGAAWSAVEEYVQRRKSVPGDAEHASEEDA